MTNGSLLAGRYGRIYRQLKGLFTQKADRTARMATIAALLYHKMPHHFWTGFYIVRDKILTVGPYQGPLACQVLEKPKGVCWAAVIHKKSIIVPNVHEYQGHIACDSRSNSEIVVPLFESSGEPWAVLDVDSRKLGSFTSVDQEWLERIVSLIETG